MSPSIQKTQKKKVGIAGCGTIEQKVATDLDQGKVPRATLVGMTSG